MISTAPVLERRGGGFHVHSHPHSYGNGSGGSGAFWWIALLVLAAVVVIAIVAFRRGWSRRMSELASQNQQPYWHGPYRQSHHIPGAAQQMQNYANQPTYGPGVNHHPYGPGAPAAPTTWAYDKR
jgi:hypothetical protein